eukprot:6795051-Alexandrium_andersonii.AAC.1
MHWCRSPECEVPVHGVCAPAARAPKLAARRALCECMADHRRSTHVLLSCSQRGRECRRTDASSASSRAEPKRATSFRAH